MQTHCESCGLFQNDYGRCDCADGQHKVFRRSDGSFAASPDRLSSFQRFMCVALASLIFFGLLGSLAFGQSIDERFQQALEAELTPVVEPVPIIIPPPVPDPDVPAIEPERPSLAVTYELPAKAAAGLEYFKFFTGDACVHCDRMKNAGFVEAVEAAGFECRVQNVSKEPHPDVRQMPQVWLYAGDTPVRRWIGYTTAENVLKPLTVDGACQLKANDKSWSGCAIGPRHILTCAHHEERSGFFARFPLEFGADDYVQVRCELVKIDPKADLCLLSYSMPTLVSVNHFTVSDPLPVGTKISGFLEGTKPKRLKLSRNDRRAKVAGLAVDGYFGEGVQSPQFGMSGSPVLTETGVVVGVQVLGAGNQIDAVSLETIRGFLSDVDLSPAPEAPALMTIEHADANQLGEVLVSALAYHAISENRTPETENAAAAGFFEVEFDVPDTPLEIARRVLSEKVIDFPAAGVSLEWSGHRRIDLKPGRLAVTPGVQMRVSKFGLSKSCRLDAITYNDDLSSVTFELSGMIDLTVRLN